MALFDQSGEVTVRYRYGAWGEMLRCWGLEAETVGFWQPFRYRGYLWDWETGDYYCRSRQYRAEWGRFISSDSTIVIHMSQNSIADHAYSYCGNQPITREDDGGHFWHLVVGGIIGGVIGAVSAAFSGGDVVDVLIGAVAGAASGVLAASGAGALGEALGSAAISIATNALTQGYHISIDEKGETQFDMGSMLFDGAVGLIGGALGGRGASYGNTAGIKSAGKQLFRRGFLNQQARDYYFKVAHRAGGEYVFKPLLESLKISAAGSAVIVLRNRVEEALADE